MATPTLSLERIYDAPVEKVWRALTEPDQLKQWFFPMMADFKPAVGFTTQWDVTHNGRLYPHKIVVTEAIPNKRIAYTWQYVGYPGNSVVCFALEPLGDQTQLTLTHTITESFESERYPDFSNENFKQGWTHFVGSLQNFVEL
ncbi:SRPBCC family protein [Flavobacterium caeni]|uniref:Uncharacterized conserved protein YndB, AHSA1/START domain n=1 Tax=Flavobacterium caeni TaxID=490189 RepID=A0A1G5HPF1_9FLAO|nr:SRPBCC domain-containing protein [Flavobacterium caeni]SCY65607.1 Uncharacterized conserved protein YndB, AHSA1/START domain [Flavobacterium caeni]